MKTISITKAHMLGLLLIPLLAIPYYVFDITWGVPNVKDYVDSFVSGLLFFLVILLSMFVHEVIHAMFFALYSKYNWKSVKIGVIWKFLTPYAHCNDPLSVVHYRIVILMPLIILGLVPLFAGLAFGSYFLFVFGCFLTYSAGGDIIMFFLTLRIPKDRLLLDHHKECGFYVLENEN